MPIHFDRRNKCWRFKFNRLIAGKRYRASRLLPKAWSQAEADAYDRAESGRLYAVAAGVGARDPLISDAVKQYITDKQNLKSIKTATEHLGAIAWAYKDKPMSALGAVSEAIKKEGAALAPATVKQRLALLKAACRWGWRKGMTAHDPTGQIVMPQVNNERHVYRTRKQMLQACRACNNWRAQIAIRVGFYTGMRLGEILRAKPDGNAFILADTKNGDRRAIPAHPKIRHLLRFFPLGGTKPGVQAAFRRAFKIAGIEGTHFHDIRHSSASEMVNAGVDLYTVGKVLGHRDQRSTARYSHLNNERLAEAVGKIGKRA